MGTPATGPLSLALELLGVYNGLCMLTRTQTSSRFARRIAAPPIFACAWLTLWLLSCLSMQAASAREYPPEVIYHLKKGNELMRAGKLPAARQEFEEALALESKCPEAYNNIGLCYLRDGVLDKAAESFRSALKIEPLYMPSLNNLGSVMYRKRNYDEAIVFYEQALSLTNGSDAEIHTNLANVMRDKGDYSGALDHYRQSIKLAPDFAPAYNNLGLTLHRMKRFSDAAVQVRKAIHLKPDYSEAYYNLGLILEAMGDTGGAVTALESSLKHETNPEYAEDTRKKIRSLSRPTTKEQHLAKGYDFLEKRQWKLAEQEFAQALKAPGHEGDALAWNNLALALSYQERFPEAISAYRKAIELSPAGFAAAQYNLGQALRTVGDTAGAERAFRQAIKDGKGTHALAHNALGLLLKQRGDVKGAVKSYKLAILQSGDALPVVHYNLAIAMEKMESSRDAVREYKIYLSQAPHGLNARRAKERLRRLGVEVP